MEDMSMGWVRNTGKIVYRVEFLLLNFLGDKVTQWKMHNVYKIKNSQSPLLLGLYSFQDPKSFFFFKIPNLETFLHITNNAKQQKS